MAPRSLTTLSSQLAISECYGSPVVLQHFHPNTNIAQYLTPNLSVQNTYRVKYVLDQTLELKSIHDWIPDLLAQILLLVPQKVAIHMTGSFTELQTHTTLQRNSHFDCYFPRWDEKPISISYLPLS